MRKIIASEFYSLDGHISDPKDEMEWVLNTFSEDLGVYEDELYANADILMQGRITYKIFESYWPGAAENTSSPDYGMAQKIHNMRKIVFSKTLKEVTWKHSEIKNNIEPDDINKIKREKGKNILLIGSAEIVRQFLRFNLIDELHLMVHPVILGEGKPLFNREKHNLTLKESKQFSNGVVGLFYEKA